MYIYCFSHFAFYPEHYTFDQETLNSGVPLTDLLI